MSSSRPVTQNTIRLQVLALPLCKRCAESLRLLLPFNIPERFSISDIGHLLQQGRQQKGIPTHLVYKYLQSTTWHTAFSCNTLGIQFHTTEKLYIIALHKAEEPYNHLSAHKPTLIWVDNCKH